ncbi:MAG: hypothetical protein RL347_2119, partial [Actinomycetota bacterium]
GPRRSRHRAACGPWVLRGRAGLTGLAVRPPWEPSSHGPDGSDDARWIQTPVRFRCGVSRDRWGRWDICSIVHAFDRPAAGRRPKEGPHGRHLPSPRTSGPSTLPDCRPCPFVPADHPSRAPRGRGAGAAGRAAAGGLACDGHGPGRQAWAVAVTVQPGDTLWGIASSVDPGADPRALIAEIRDVNGLAQSGLTPGQVLQVPVH